MFVYTLFVRFGEDSFLMLVSLVRHIIEDRIRSGDKGISAEKSAPKPRNENGCVGPDISGFDTEERRLRGFNFLL
ncbi:hypothetical protein D4R52_02095 [bacterium]|nr:MAG: hypothetical protein D4R52_02095 [bacterium]